MSAKCNVCGDEFSAGVYCSVCHTPNHEECFQYAGKCSVMACGGQYYFTLHDKTGKPVSLEKLPTKEITDLVVKKENSLPSKNLETFLQHYLDYKAIKETLPIDVAERYDPFENAMEATFGLPNKHKKELYKSYINESRRILDNWADKYGLLGIGFGGLVFGLVSWGIGYFYDIDTFLMTFGGVIIGLISGGIIGFFQGSSLDKKEDKTPKIKALTEKYTKLLEVLDPKPMNIDH